MSTENNNLSLWNRVEKTNPKYTKEAKIGGHKITAIAPQYQIMQVTEQFGIYGEKWGFKDIELSYDLVEKCNLVVFKGTFFFPNGEFEIINSCKLYMDRACTMVDDNFAKKIETDALTKAISKLGFNADIFMGKFDDVRYIEEMKQAFKDPKELEEEKRIAEEKAKENLRLHAVNKILVSCKTLADLQKQYLSLSDLDKKVFTKLVTELKTKLTPKN